MQRLLDPKTLKVVWTILAVIGALALVYLLRTVLLLLAFAVVFAYLIFPLVKLVERGLPGSRRRQLALVGPPLGRELAALGDKFPEMSTRIQSGRVIGNIFPGWKGAEILDDLVRLHLPQVVEYAQHGLAGAVTGVIDDHERRRLSVTIALDLHSVLGEYVRAQVLLCALTFVVWTVLFLVAGVPYALVLAAIGGALEFLPVLGPLAAGVTVIAVALFSGFAHPGLLALFVLVWRLLQDYVSSPLIMGRGVELHPGLVIFGVLAGGELAGVAGMFLSVPVIAGLRVVWRRLRDFRAEPEASRD